MLFLIRNVPGGDPPRFIDGEPSHRRERLASRAGEEERIYIRVRFAVRSSAGNNSATIARETWALSSCLWHVAIYKLTFRSTRAPTAMGWRTRFEYRKDCGTISKRAPIGFQEIGSRFAYQ